MKPLIKKFYLIVVSIMISQTNVYGSDNSVTIFPAEGSKRCLDYSANSYIKEMSMPSGGAVGQLFGPDSSQDADSLNEKASYTIDKINKTASFVESTTPVDYAILKNANNIAVIIYPSGGVNADNNMQLVVNGAPVNIERISLCYGLGNMAKQPIPTTTPRCEDLNNGAGLDGMGIQCPQNGQRSLVFNLELDKAFYNTENTPVACVCNSDEPLKECDPSAKEGELNACPDPSRETMATEVTTHIELNNDPYYCTTVAGARRCYAY